ncbi:nucleotidyltransferase domain-containing protein [Sphingomonas pruni]|uniref:nucleotidyltransferase domain-containing protein n=1 Tax=Sphingomonas pruni TaxID=40683 RepID=UPI0008376730|nr:nucleotidyltransferase domain-containing protein [Sphingomonas pruni]
MSAALILYGSRARGDARADSDTDLILAVDGDRVGQPRATSGISVHQYGKAWLLNQAAAGDLFAYHVAYEGSPILDDLHFLAEMKAATRLKVSYETERRTAALVMRMLLERDWQDDAEIRRRYFWALRTIAITITADLGAPVFASRDVEAVVGIEGLSHHIEERNIASFRDCEFFGMATLERTDLNERSDLRGEALKDDLVRLGGIAADSVRLFEMRDVEKGGGLAIYM